jgi:hypothetical protein
VTVFDVALVENKAPFEKKVANAMIEGVLNSVRKSLGIGDLPPDAADSPFRVRVDLPGAADATLPARLTSDAAGGDARDLVLARNPGGVFLSNPVLAIPLAIPRNEITMKPGEKLEVFRTRAQAKLAVEIKGPLTGMAKLEAPVRGPVLRLCTLTIKGAKPDPARDLATANRALGQVGLEVRTQALPEVDDPTLLSIRSEGGTLTEQKKKLFALGRDACPFALICYYTRRVDSAAFAFTRAAQNAVVMLDAPAPITLAHELGHAVGLPDRNKGNLNPTPTEEANLMFWAASGDEAANDVLLTHGQYHDLRSGTHVQILG